ncbi:MAG: nitrilase-related carbon-nitrogen hydrolase [Thermaerobacterales bacterium]
MGSRRSTWLKDLQGQALKVLMYWESRPSRIRRMVRSHNLQSQGLLRRIDPTALRLAAVQMQLELVGSPEAYVEQVVALGRQAAEQGAQLIAFPEDTSTPLLGLLPGFKELARQPLDDALKSMGETVKPVDVFRLAGTPVRRIYTAVFSEVARRLQVYVHGGSALLPGADGHVYNVAHLFGPDGRLLGMQRKAHLLPLESEWGLSTGDSLQVIDTAMGRVGIPVCMDATYWETFRILYLQGADLAVLPAANPEPYDEWRVIRGLWARLQESPMYGIQSCMVGNLFGMTLTGRSGIFGPAAISPQGDGVWARLDDPESEGVAAATVDLKALYAHRTSMGLDQAFNPILYERYFPEVYQRLERRRDRRTRGAGGRGGRKGRNRRPSSRSGPPDGPTSDRPDRRPRRGPGQGPGQVRPDGSIAASEQPGAGQR